MATVGRGIADLELTERELWLDGPPLEAFREMRGKCPIHWTESFEEFPEEAGFWSVTSAEDVHTVSRDWRPTPRNAAAWWSRRPAFRSSSHARCSSAWIRPSTIA